MGVKRERQNMKAPSLELDPAGYVNWGTIFGSDGYGIRATGGKIEFKDFAGAWTDFSGMIAAGNGAVNAATAGQVAFYVGAQTVDGSPDLTWDDGGGSVPTAQAVLKVGPTVGVGMWFSAPTYNGFPSGSQMFADTRHGIDSNGTGSMLALQALAGVGQGALNIYSNYTDDQNFDALSIQPHYIAIWRSSSGSLVDTQLLVTGEGNFGVSLTDEGAGLGWATGLAGSSAWQPITNFGDTNNNAQDLGTSSNQVRTGYFGTSIVNAGYDQFAEMTPPAGATDVARIYADVSGVKTRLMVVFQSGAAQQIAIEP